VPDKIVERVKAMAKGGFVGLHELVDRATDEPTPTIERDATGALVLREKKVDAHSRAAADRKIGQVERVKLLRRLVAALKIVGSPVESLFRTHLDRIVEMFDDQAKHVPEVVAEYDVRCRVAYAAGPFNIGTYQPEIYLQAATAVQQAAITRAVGLARSAPAAVGASPTSGGSGTGGQRWASARPTSRPTPSARRNGPFGAVFAAGPTTTQPATAPTRRPLAATCSPAMASNASLVPTAGPSAPAGSSMAPATASRATGSRSARSAARAITDLSTALAASEPAGRTAPRPDPTARPADRIVTPIAADVLDVVLN
jgi:hypothetical protein